MCKGVLEPQYAEALLSETVYLRRQSVRRVHEIFTLRLVHRPQLHSFGDESHGVHTSLIYRWK